MRRLISRLCCAVGLHQWVKRGGTRVGGLFRRCPCCGVEDAGYESGGYVRGIEWVRLPANTRIKPTSEASSA